MRTLARRCAFGLAVLLTGVGCGSSASPVDRVGSRGSTSSDSIVEPGVTTSLPADSSTITSTTSHGSTTATTMSVSTTSSAPPVGATAVQGDVTAGPTCPVEREDEPCPPRPVTRTRVEALASGRIAGSAVTDDDGRYAIPLDPGQYTLHVATDASFPRCSDVEVTVTSGPPVRADIDCDTGIR